MGQPDGPGEGQDANRPLFEDIAFHIALSHKLDQQEADEVAALLQQNGARQAVPRTNIGKSRINIDLEEVTHIIAADIHFPGYTEAERNMIPVVTSEWVRTSVRKSKIVPVRQFTPDPRLFFSGVTVTVAELPPGDKEAICGGVMAMGGAYSNALSKMTTHVVALSTENAKCRQVKEKNLKNVKIVLPHWFDDCLKLGRRIREDPYMFPNPEITRVSSAENLNVPPRLDMAYSHLHPDGPSPEEPPSMRGTNMFEDKRFLLSSDLGINDHLRNSIGEIITEAKGEVVKKITDANAYVCHFREGSDYVAAMRKGIFVGNMTWLYWMFSHGEWTSPMTRLLHYPVVRGGLPGMAKALITVSNYGGDARLYLENLISACGAKFTKSMRVENTHLITARAHSEKCIAAKEWNIHTVNHLWLEESYAKWEIQSLSNPKYTHFPPRTNLMEVIGNTQVDAKALEQFYLNETELERSLEPVPVVKRTIKIPKAATPKVQNDREMGPSSSVTGSGRKAKEQAVTRLHDVIAPDILQYDKERKRKGGVVGGGRRRASDSSPERPKSRKRTASLEAGTEDEGGRVAKKGKKRPKPTIFLLITAYTGWLDRPEKEDRDKKILGEIGVRCVSEPKECTYLAAPHIVRTEKFLRALVRVPIIVSMDWVHACIEAEKIVDADQYKLQDPEGEKRLNVNLEDSLRRAEQNRGRLLEGQTVYCTPGVHGGYDTCQRIVEANGGVCISFRMAKRAPNAPDSERLVLLSGDEASDRKLWVKFHEMALGCEKQAIIYRADWLLDAAMSQTITWDDKYEVGKK